MMEFKESPHNTKIFLEIEDLENRTKESIKKSWFKVGPDLIAEANRQILRLPKTGRVYFISRNGRRRAHRSSAPGESHANMFGGLRNSLSYLVRGWDIMEFGYGASPSRPAPEYAQWVEFGTRRMAARPTLNNTIGARQKATEAFFEKGKL